MNRFVLTALIAGLVLCIPTLASPEEDADAAFFRKFMEETSPTVVTVKFVMKVHMQMGVQERDQEVEREINGVLVSADGLIVVSNADVTVKSRDPRMTLTGVPTDFKVIFQDDEEEYDAVLGATDSNLNLAFVALKDPKACEFSHVDFAAAVKPQVGQELLGVSRLPRGFDFAPFYGTVRITSKVAKPRRMYLTAGTFTVPAMVLFDRSGAPAGIMSVQEGASGSGRAVFLLPADIVKATIKQAAESVKEVLAEEKPAEEKPAEEKPAEEKPADEAKPADEGKPGDDDKPGHDDKPGDEDKPGHDDKPDDDK
jgi:uncharacterized low-complexity protein